MGLETVNAFRQPALLERLVKLQSGCLQLHAGFPAVGRLGAPADKAVNLLFDVDERLFHGAKAYAFNRGNASGAKQFASITDGHSAAQPQSK
jgi:hypothetical protein